jgi:uncharacterized short protein YbdD (DUF466 family)
MERKEKLLALKLNNLFKEVGHWKCKTYQMHVLVGFYDYNKDLMHAKNEHVHILFMTNLLFSTGFWLMSPLNKNVNACNSLCSFTFLFMDIPWSTN